MSTLNNLLWNKWSLIRYRNPEILKREGGRERGTEHNHRNLQQQAGKWEKLLTEKSGSLFERESGVYQRLTCQLTLVCLCQSAAVLNNHTLLFSIFPYIIVLITYLMLPFASRHQLLLHILPNQPSTAESLSNYFLK